MRMSLSVWPMLGSCLAMVDGLVCVCVCSNGCEHCLVYLAGVGLCCMFGW